MDNLSLSIIYVCACVYDWENSEKQGLITQVTANRKRANN